MIVKTAEFLLGAVRPEQFPHLELPQIVFAGRSNAGKSTLINSLLNMKNMVRVSREPGKTREINFFLVNKKFLAVDLPGYGYARVSYNRRLSWGNVILSYLNYSASSACFVIAVDIRRGVQELDQMLFSLLQSKHVPFKVVLTKTDKLSGTEIQKAVHRSLPLCLGADQIILFSKNQPVGRDNLWKVLHQFIELSICSPIVPKPCGR